MVIVPPLVCVLDYFGGARQSTVKEVHVSTHTNPDRTRMSMLDQARTPLVHRIVSLNLDMVSELVSSLSEI